MYPKTFVHRHNQHAQVVVATPEQEAELPADFILHASHGSAPSPADELAKLEQARQALEADRTALAAERAALDDERARFNTLQDHTSNELSAISGQIEAERQQLAADRAAHQAERDAFDAQRNVAQRPPLGADQGTGEKPAESAAAEGAAIGETGTTPAAPAKRTRGAKAEG